MSSFPAPRSFFRRFWIPLGILTLGIVIEIVNWTTNLVSETLVPQFGNSARSVVGRNIALLMTGLLLIWLLFTRHLPRRVKWTALGCIAVLAAGVAASIRDIENTGNNSYVFHFRWEPTQDQRLAAFHKTAHPVSSHAILDTTTPRLTDFLGPKRDGIIPGPKLVKDLSKTPPKELWRRPVGSGYASCVLASGLAVTVEQRGDEETVVAYDLATGTERWVRTYPGHFKESLGGNGPRATPTISGNEVFALGANGLLVALNLTDGLEKWKTNILQDASAANITWGMCGAPLVTGNKVIVNPGGSNGFGVVAYDRSTGKPVWHAGGTKAGYSTPVLTTLCEQDTVLIFDSAGVAGHAVETGVELWRYSFPTLNGINVAQPLVLPGNQVLITAGYDAGAVLLQLKKEENKWTVTPVWQNKRLKCKMGSPVYYQDHLYGLDDGILVCLDARTGERKWKGGRYGHGQILLRHDLLIIMGEAGDLIYVAADPKELRELSKMPMLPGGKTWNAPALAGNMLLLRNHFEAVLLELAVE